MSHSQQDNLLSTRHRFSASSTSSFLLHFGGCSGGLGGGEQEMDIVMLDHGYAKPWSAHPDASNARPVRLLFMPKQTRSSASKLQQGNDVPIDVVNAPPAPSMPFDINKARNLMTECERHASYARPDSMEDWEDRITKQGWTIQQNRVFTKVIKALQADRLARLAMDSVSNEPIARRQLVDKTAKRIRQALTSVGWDMAVVQWLHQLILDTVSIHLLASYLDALQTLKSKVPQLVDKMVSGAPPKHPSLSQESLGLLLKRPWDPINNVLMQHKLGKLPNNPLLLLAPSGPTQSGCTSSGQTKRLKFWQAHLNTLGKTITVNMSGGSGVSMMLCLEQMIGALRTKVLEQKSHVQNRPIILVGWNIGALVACHVSLVESVSAVVCLGFPFTGIHGPRGDCEDPLLSVTTPTLLVVGENASDCCADQLQDLREHMRAQTGMLLVGGADEQLRLSHRKKREEGVTQAMADRWIIEEVNQFLGSILSMNAGSPENAPAEVLHNPADFRRRRKRKATDLIAGNTVDAQSAVGLTDTIFGLSAGMSNESGRVSKRGGKASRQMAAAGLGLSSERGRGGPRKRQTRGGGGGGGGGMGVGGARKRVALGMGPLGLRGRRSGASAAAGGLQAGGTTPLNTTTATLSAVTSAPELYGLLQGIPVSRAPREGEQQQQQAVVFGGAARSLMGASFPRAKLLALNRLKEEVEAGRGAGVVGPVVGGVPTTTATMLASTLRAGGFVGEVGGSGDNKDKLAQQILVRTGGSASSSAGGGGGSPLTIPISMATPRLVAGGGGGGMGVSSPLVHITGATSSSHIHQLLTTSLAQHCPPSSNTTTTTAGGGHHLHATAAGHHQQATLLINAVPSPLTSSSSSSSSMPGEGGSLDAAGQALDKRFRHLKEIELDVVRKGKESPSSSGAVLDAVRLAGLHSSQYHDFPITTVSLTNPAMVLSQTASVTKGSSVLTQASLTTTGLSSSSSSSSSAVLTPGCLASHHHHHPHPHAHLPPTTKVLTPASLAAHHHSQSHPPGTRVLTPTSLAGHYHHPSTTKVLTPASLAGHYHPSTTKVLTPASLAAHYHPSTTKVLTPASLAAHHHHHHQQHHQHQHLPPSTKVLTPASLAAYLHPQSSKLLTQASLAARPSPSSSDLTHTTSNPSAVLIHAKPGGGGEGGSSSASASSSSSSSKPPTIVQLAVTKSLISGSSILGKVMGSVAQAGHTTGGSPISSSMASGGRNTVLISTTMAKSLSSAGSPSILFGKAGSGGTGGSFVLSQEALNKVLAGGGGGGGETATSTLTPTTTSTTTTTTTSYTVKPEMLGKVSSVLEFGSILRHMAQPIGGVGGAGGASSLVTGTLSLAKPPSVVSSLNTVKPPVASSSSSILASGQPSAAPPPVAVVVPGSVPNAATPSVLASVTAPAAVTVSDATAPSGSGSVAGSGRGGHKSANVSSYAASAKPVMPTIASTRTRRIRTPKQYDL